ncbi:hypothetical protein ACFVAV_13345 [Nocardia sp. NPDC057663]|uniref:hypothetical protein n=1 Tax=Nocardia sp. NPDC057663 TaxID=3346201 RepID=UPI0036713193
MSARRWVTAAGLVGVAVVLLVVGAATWPLLVDDHTLAEPILGPIEIGFAQDMLTTVRHWS